MRRPVLRTSFSGSSSVGVFARATDEFVLVRPDLTDEVVESISSELAVPAITTTIGGASTVGALAVANDNGIIVSEQILEIERERLEANTNLPVEPLPDRLNAAGNVILANNNGALVHTEMSDHACSVIEDTLDVPIERGTIAGIPTVGTAAVATKRGILCHPKTSAADLESFEDLFRVRADIGTINYGGPLIGAGLIANTSGYITGAETTGPELGRIEDALGFV